MSGLRHVDPHEVFVIIVSRDASGVSEKLRTFEKLGLDHIVICGEMMNIPRVYFRAPRGKFDAINYGFSKVPHNKTFVILNDADSMVLSPEKAFEHFADPKVGMVHGTIQVAGGPQVLFYRILYRVIDHIGPVAANGEYTVVRREILNRILPLPPCKAEDSLLMFKVLEAGYQVVYDRRVKVLTKRTTAPEKEEDYKRINVAGIYQALSYSSPPPVIRAFYFLLPIFAPLLLIAGQSGRFWLKGIIEGLADFLKGDRSGSWQPTYLE